YAATDKEAAIELKEDAFTKEELMKLYWKCGDVLHRGTFQTLWSRGRADIEEIRTWKQKIEALLSYHTIFMADGRTAALFRRGAIQVGTVVPGTCALFPLYGLVYRHNNHISVVIEPGASHLFK